MEFEHPNLVCQRLVVGHQHAPFGAGQVLDGVEGEDGGAAGADPALPVAGADRVGGILDDRYAVLAGQCQDRIQIDRGAGVVDRDDGFGVGGDERRDQLGAGHQGIRVHVDEDRLGPSRVIMLMVETQVWEG